jgi:hypothetical protein
MCEGEGGGLGGGYVLVNVEEDVFLQIGGCRQRAIRADACPLFGRMKFNGVKRCWDVEIPGAGIFSEGFLHSVGASIESAEE